MSLSHSHTHTLCLSQTHRAPRCLPLGPTSPPSVRATRSPWLGRLTRRVTHSHGLTPFRTPPPASPRRSHTEEPPSRPAPRPGLSPSIPGRGVSGARRLLKLQVPPPPPPHARPGLEPRPEDAQVPGQGAQRRAGVRARKAPGQDAGAGGARGPGCGIRRAGELPQRRWEAGGAARARIPLAPASGIGLRAGTPRLLLTWPPRGSSSSPAPRPTRCPSPARRAHGRPRSLRAF